MSVSARAFTPLRPQDFGGKTLFSQTEAGKIINRSRWVVAEMLDRFEMKFVPRGRRGRDVPLSEINKWLERNTVGNAEEYRQVLDGRRTS